MPTSLMRVAASLLTLTVLSVGPIASPVEARRLTLSAITVQVEVRVPPLPAGEVPEATWMVSLEGKQVEWPVLRLFVVTGNVSPTNLYQALVPYRPTLRIVGRPPDLDRLVGAPPGSRLRFQGLLEISGGARILMVSGVEVFGNEEPAPVTDPATPPIAPGPEPGRPEPSSTPG